MASSSESHGTHDMNIALDEARARDKTAMTAPLDEKGLEAAHVAYERYGQAGDLKTQRLSSGCIEAIIRAYLAASPSPSEMEVVAWDRLRDLIGEYFDLGYAEGVVQRDVDTMAGDAQRTLSDIEVVISQAQSALAAMRVEIERLRAIVSKDPKTVMIAFEDGDHMRLSRAASDAQKRAEMAEIAEDEAKDSFWAIYPRYLELGGEPVSTEAARTDLAAQVLRLTEENEALRKALRPFAEIAEAYDDDEDDGFEVWKDFDTLGSSLPLRIFRLARTTLQKEQADGQ